MEINYLRSAGVVVTTTEQNRTYLLATWRRYSDEDKGWALPKGQLEKHEDPQTAALRELVEETGLENVENVEYVTSTAYPFVKDGQPHIKSVNWFSGESQSGNRGKKALSDEDVRNQLSPFWLPLRMANQFLLFKEEKSVVNQVFPLLLKNTKKK